MKKLLALILSLCLVLSGCSVQQVQQDSSASSQSQPSAQEAQAAQAEAVDLDFTRMSSTMVYAYVYNIVCSPEDFLGQRCRIGGISDQSYWDQTDTVYHYVVIEDATACCAQGLEFVLTSEDDAYPLPGADIEISGEWAQYEEDGEIYFHILADQIVLT